MADPEAAPFMQAYMKSSMPYLGVKLPVLRKTAKEVFRRVPLDDAETWRTLVLGLWRAAKYREERYAAIVLSGDRRAKRFQTLEALPMYEELIVTGAWWDFVDELAQHRVGPLLAAYPKPMKKTMRAWSRGANMWKRRTSILCQLAADEIDLELLYACIEPSLASREFFLRKAIGWALRDLAWRDPDEALRYVRSHASELSPLSKREAVKNLLKQGVIRAVP